MRNEISDNNYFKWRRDPWKCFVPKKFIVSEKELELDMFPPETTHISFSYNFNSSIANLPSTLNLLMNCPL
jgi:hypothetical protein